MQGRLGMSTVAKGYEEAVRTLYGLQSNAAVISAWKQERRSNLKVDLRPEMLYHCSLLVRISSPLPLPSPLLSPPLHGCAKCLARRSQPLSSTVCPWHAKER